MRNTDVKTPKEEWQWKKMCAVADLMPTDAGTTSAAVKYGDSQLAIFHVPKRGYYATQQVCLPILRTTSSVQLRLSDVPAQACLRS
jgi:nitrite reductase (NAD(P)H)